MIDLDLTHCPSKSHIRPSHREKERGSSHTKEEEERKERKKREEKRRKEGEGSLA